ncbi:MAG: hypothetical protein N0C88_20950 [Candidatus Thiodiazotropha lotti]|uniref:Uncharacterized protein n=1 Tax=Candidatus Thiodiazotropha lotti TaxID=2792787 RepID=A0A9E4N192_9GAMM|nr:hypothetical protein [Candidatus Thiodiazotropha lotti]MCW4205775.1 hypothetical protein [Candidatus Thiodiazotropha lotti]
MSDFEKLSEIKSNQKIVVDKPKGELFKIISKLQNDHKIENVFGQVRCNFDPLAYRSEAIDFPRLIEDLKNKYGLAFETPKIIKMAMERDKGIDVKLFHDALESPEGLEFKHGLIQYEQEGDLNELILRRVNLHSQNITIALDGSTDEAEIILQKITADVLDNQGLNSAWSVFKRHIGGMNYLTTTNLDLGTDPLVMFSEQMKSYIHDKVEGQYGNHMANIPMHGVDNYQGDFIFKCSLDSIAFNISIFDKKSGSQDNFEFRLDSSDRRLRGTGYLTITSRLKYEDHMRAINDLIQSLECHNN